MLPDSRTTYAALARRSGERLNLAIDLTDLGPILEEMRRGLGLASLSVWRDGTALAHAGAANPAPVRRIPVRHDADTLATLEVGEKLRHDTFLAADNEVLSILCQQLGGFLMGHRLLLQLREAVDQLQEMQRHLLTARRRERERLSQHLHRGPLQEVVLLRQTLAPGSSQAAAATQIETSLRAILTETASALLHDFGLPAAIRAYVAYLTPYVNEQGRVLAMELDDTAGGLAEDEAFALYQLAHEALSNAVRHSECRRLTVRVGVAEDLALLEVYDDGCGLPPDWEQARADHRGLRDALELVRTIKGATASAATSAGSGTVVQARVQAVRKALQLGIVHVSE